MTSTEFEIKSFLVGFCFAGFLKSTKDFWTQQLCGLNTTSVPWSVIKLPPARIEYKTTPVKHVSFLINLPLGTGSFHWFRKLRPVIDFANRDPSLARYGQHNATIIARNRTVNIGNLYTSSSDILIGLNVHITYVYICSSAPMSSRYVKKIIFKNCAQLISNLILAIRKSAGMPFTNSLARSLGYFSTFMPCCNAARTGPSKALPVNVKARTPIVTTVLVS